MIGSSTVALLYILMIFAPQQNLRRAAAAVPSRVRKRIADPALNEGIIDRVISRGVSQSGYVVVSKFKLSVCNDRGS